MGQLTLAELVNTARAELGLLPFNAAPASSADYIDIQMIFLLNRVGAELQTEYAWAALQTEFIVSTEVAQQTTGDTFEGLYVITNIPDTSGMSANSYVVTGTGIPVSARIASVDSPTQITLNEPCTTTVIGNPLVVARDTYAGPSDFQSYVSETWWDRTNRWKLLGPTSPQMDQFLRSGIVTTSPRRNWRQIGRPYTNWRIWPAPQSNQPTMTMVYEYMSLAWATSAAGDHQTSMTLDSDTCIFPDDVMITGLKSKFFQSKGMDTTFLDAEYRRAKDRAKGADAGAAVLSLTSRGVGSDLLSYWNIPDNGYGPR